MRAVILAGGKGTRLGPFTTILPKPLLPIGDRAILELLVEQLRVHGFTRLTLAVGYLSHLIEAVFGDGSAYGVSIDYHHEDEPLGTAGALAGVRGLDEPFLMLNGDVITTLDFAELVAVHVAGGSALTIATQVRRATIDFGVLQVEEGDGMLQTVTGYLEKPSSEYAVSMGVYVIDPRLLRLIRPGAYLDFPDLVLKALAANEQVASYGYEGLWLDIGRHEDYEQAISAEPDLATVLKEAAARNHFATAGGA
jgi:NDP-sugar pyrophosphorylase family protein